MGDGAWMTILDPRSFEDSGLVWALSWGSASVGAVTATAAAFDVPAGTTVTHAGVARNGTAGTANVGDSVAVTSQAFASQGVYTVTYSYTQS